MRTGNWSNESRLEGTITTTCGARVDVGNDSQGPYNSALFEFGYLGWMSHNVCPNCIDNTHAAVLLELRLLFAVRTLKLT